MSEAGVLEFIVLIDESPLKVIEKFTLLTGSPQLPPISALGYHQSRYSYMTQADVLEVSQGFIDHRIPLDVI